MADYPKPLSELIDEFRKLPGIGPKTAQRLAFNLMFMGKAPIDGLINAMENARDNIRYCSVCGNFTDKDPCPVCTDVERDKSVLCVVGHPKDLMAIERAGGYRGLYHVLHGYIQPLKGIGPDDIRINQLVHRIKTSADIKEIILATNPDTDGETTALYLVRLLSEYGVKLTRLARGLPFGADLDYADEFTIAKALEGRREMG